ncbi:MULTISPECIES: hypothetical protein [Aequorivita]|jgi:predicted tellurium resistance membrane protein TerC|uniref:Uncharacterized protein n=2 Tax=Aequorivita TaxID=153265 RepID=A0AB35YMV7_9FLAO|nr:hypothetical protein [Aequorivita sp. Ant34-E75]WGF91758.1 hypothetical protein QCQ61_11120 [Aequorivita sp. Ant34-E75]
MSTLISYLLAAILQFIGASMPTEQETVSAMTHQQCETTASVLPYSFIINNELKSQKLIRNK